MSSRPFYPIPYTAADNAALDQRTTDFVAWLRAHADLPLTKLGAEVASQLDEGAPVRRYVLARDASGAAAALEAADPRWVFGRTRETADEASATSKDDIAFMLSGAEALRPVGADVYSSLTTFHAIIDELSEVFLGMGAVDPRSVLFSTGEGTTARASVEVHPAVFTLEYALAATWHEWGIRPGFVIGHSFGEIACAAISGALGLADACKLALERARLVEQTAEGRMLAVSLSADEVAPLLEDGVSLAAINGSRLCILSGAVAEINATKEWLESRDIKCGMLGATTAYHSSLVEPIRTRLRAVAATLDQHTPEVRYVSGVTGKWLTPRQATAPGYWSDHVRSTVRFHDGLRTLLRRSPRALLEVGPARTLSKLAQQFVSEQDGASVPVVASFASSPYWSDATTNLLAAAGTLWTHGAPLNWERLYEDLAMS